MNRLLATGGKARLREAQRQGRSHFWLQILAEVLQTELIRLNLAYSNRIGD